MKRKLFTQMRHNWRANAWMLVELVIVSIVLWAMGSILIPVVAPVFRPTAYTDANLYGTTIRLLDTADPRFKPYADSLHSYTTDMHGFIARLRNNPHIGEAGVGIDLQPYTSGFYGMYAYKFDEVDSVGLFVNMRQSTPEAIKAMGIKGAHGQDADELARIIESGRMLLAASDKVNADEMRDRYQGKRFILGDSARVFTVGAIIPLYPRNHYEMVPYTTVIAPADENTAVYNFANLIVRVKPGEGSEFIKSLTADDLAYGNIYVMPFKSFEQARGESQAIPAQKVRNFVVCMVFLLICVFMGLFGTFWLRTAQSAPEIAIRKVNGATRADIMRRFMAEGMILMAIAFAISLPIDYWLYRYAISHEQELEIAINETHSLYAVAVSAVSMALVVAIAIWLPARRAMKVDPATALKSE